MQLCGCTTTPVARWVYDDGVSGTLCHPHLDMWLDNADDYPDMEPARIVWL